MSEDQFVLLLILAFFILTQAVAATCERIYCGLAFYLPLWLALRRSKDRRKG